MNSYSITRFTVLERDFLQQAIELVDAIPNDIGADVRCHELARAIGQYLNLPVQDGKFEAVEHSWLWCRPGWVYASKSNYRDVARNAPPPVLDVYVPGCLPQVQLVDWAYWGLPYKRVYIPGSERDDVDDAMVSRLLILINGK